MEMLSENPERSKDEGTEGFDMSAGRIWIYPNNYPIRDYQFAIVQTALYNNTLVCLPTGLGKTFIAAVVMYNYWRWYPKGKVIFLAPTRPLAMQQVDACHTVMGIPTSEIEVLLGNANAKKREVAWSDEEIRIIFATPQVFQNDLKNNIAPANMVKCVVVDEAHRALGKHSYSECMKILSEKNKHYRVLALSATPGNKMTDVHEVVRNLHIASLEIRDENSPDIVPYTNEKQVKIIVVELGSVLEKYKEKYVAIMDRHVKYLAKCNVIHNDTANISKGRIFYLLQESKTNGFRNNGKVKHTLTILMTMYHAYEVLIRNGLRTFLQFYETHSDKYWMEEEPDLKNLLEDIKDCLGPFPEFISPLAGEQGIPRNINFGHKKFMKLKELLVNHFSSESPETQNSRAIVFVECRSTVNEVYVLLLQLRPLLRAQMFVGQSGLKQKQQVQMLENFRSNRINVLISTCIGEEGLDVGEVDLIICFDVVQASPTRLVQRMGRTGRKRDGQVIFLVTNGKEHETLQNSLRKRCSISKKILNTSDIFSSLYEDNSRMIPKEITPTCCKMFLNKEGTDKPSDKSKKKKAVGKGKGKGQTSIRGSLAGDSKAGKAKGQASIAKFLVSKPADAIDLSPVSPSRPVEDQPITTSKGTIDPSDIKLLTSDDDAADFLTLCTLKKSSKDMQEETESFLAKYTRTTAVSTNYFDFKVPDTSILDTLDTMMDRLPEVPLRLTDDKLPNEDRMECDNDTFFDDITFSPLHDKPPDEDRIESENDIFFDGISFSPLQENVPNRDASPEDFERTDLKSPILSRSASVCNYEKNQNISKLETSVDDWKERSKVWDAGPSIFESLLMDSSDCSDDSVIPATDDEEIDESLKTVSKNANVRCNNQTYINSEKRSRGNIADDSLVEDVIILSDDSDIDTSRDREKQVSLNDTRDRETSKTPCDKYSSSYSKPSTSNNSLECNKTNHWSPGDKQTKSSNVSGNWNTNCTPPDSTVTAIDEPEDASLWNLTKAVGEIGRLNAEPQNKSFLESDDDLFDNLEYEEGVKHDEESILIESSPSFIEASPPPQENENVIVLTQQKSVLEKSVGKSFQDSTSDDSVKDLNKLDDAFDDAFDDVFTCDWIDVAEKSVQAKVNTNSINTPKPSTSQRETSNHLNMPIKGKTEKNNARFGLAKKLASVKKPTQERWIEPTFDDADSSDSDLILNDIIAADIDELENSSPFFASTTGFNRNAKNNPSPRIPATKQLDSSGKSSSDLGDTSPFKVPGKYVNRRKTITTKTSISGGKEIVSRDKKTSANKENNGGSTWSRKSRRQQDNVFISNEADVSSDEKNSSDETSEEDADLEGFVSHTQNVHDDSNVHAFYLQSIRSPHNKRNGFVFRKPRSPEAGLEIYSQLPSPTDNSYLYDSFCVEDAEDEEEETEYSILMEAERKLADRQRKRPRPKTTASSSRTKKRRRILNASDSSDDEVELMRAQIQNESLLSKRL